MGGRPANLGLYCVSNSNGVNSNLGANTLAAINA